MINVIISDDIKEKWPSLAIGSIEANIKIKEDNSQLWQLINKKCDEINLNIKPKEILNIRNIAKARAAYKSFGKDPSRYRVSSESLVKRIVKGYGLYKVNTVVDINNLVSLGCFHSVGTYDLSKISGPITLSLGEKNETYEGIGRGPINLENLPVFKDSLGNFGSTTSDSIRAMIKDDTNHILMNIISYAGDEGLKENIGFARNLLKDYAAGEIIETKIII